MFFYLLLFWEFSLVKSLEFYRIILFFMVKMYFRSVCLSVCCSAYNANFWCNQKILTSKPQLQSFSIACCVGLREIRRKGKKTKMLSAIAMTWIIINCKTVFFFLLTFWYYIKIRAIVMLCAIGSCFSATKWNIMLLTSITQVV